MKLTTEQNNIINSTGDIKINAVAGSGKTTTIIEYAKSRPTTARVLYLAFNKSVKLEAQKKFFEKGLYNVKVETAHSLAYKNIVFKNGYRVKSQDYKINEIAEILNLQGNGEKHTEYIIANHINKFTSYFCNSDKKKIQDLNYIETVSDNKAKVFVKTFYNYIEIQTRIFLNKMEKGEIEITHDFYLKKFQLSNPTLHFDYILFDEGQDASPAMLDVFLKQKATKVIVGDTHQQIYGWRYAVNSLEKVTFRNYNLSKSFRFEQDIANLAMDVLRWKKHINVVPDISIVGESMVHKSGSKAVIARTNLGLLLKAIEYVTEKGKVNNIYFEGNINSYTYAEDGTSLYDVLNLYNGNHQLIRDNLIRMMTDIDELEDYVKKTEESQLGMMIDIVKEYGNRIPGIIKAIKEKHIQNNEKEKAEMIFSTVHRCKGMEYDTIQIVNDFITEEKLEELKDDIGKTKNIEKLNEEINLLYVAVTRAKDCIYIPDVLIPKDFPYSAKIRIMRTSDTKEKQKETINSKMKIPLNSIDKVKIEEGNTGKSYTFEQVRKDFKDAYKPWTEELDHELTIMYCEGISMIDLSKHFGRTRGAIRSRIKKLDLKELYG